MNKKKIIYLLLMAFVIIYLLSINSIILSSMGKPTKISNGIDSIENQPVQAYIDSYFYLQDDMFDRAYLYGWAFTNSTAPTAEKKVGVVLVDEKGNSFLCANGVLGRRTDVRKHAESMGYTVNDANLGFGISFSTINLKNGKYKIGVYCYENSQNYGVTFIDMELVKENKIVRMGAISPSEIATLTGPCTGDAKTYLDDTTIDENGNARIRGWAFIPDKDPKNSKTYITLSHSDGIVQTFDTTIQERPDLVSFFGKDIYVNGGFHIQIPSDMLHSQDYIVSIAIEDENGIHTSPDMLSAVQNGLASQNGTDGENSEKKGILDIIAIPLVALMTFLYKFIGNYGLAIIVFTFITKIILFPVSMWVQKNGIVMVKITPELNRIKINHYGDKDAIDDATQSLYKREKYNPLASTVPMLVQIIMLLGVIAAVKSLLSGANSSLTLVPSSAGGLTYLMPLIAGVSALLLGLAQNKLNPLQREQGTKEQWISNGFSIALSLFLGIFVSLGVGIYWIASNLFSIVQQIILNAVINPEKYIDYEALEKSKKELAEMDNLSAEISKEDKKREQDDYKKFFSVANKHLVIYSEKSGFYKYYKDIMDFMLKYSNVIIHYVTNDPKDQIFEIAETQTRIRPYYISEKKLITMFMKMDADVVIMTCPDLDRYHLKRSYVRKDIEYVYMFHYPLSTHMVLNTGALDNYDTILCVGDFQFEEIRAAEKLYNLPEKKLISAGYGQLEQLYESYQKMEKESRDKPKILIAPSWQKDNILDSCIDPLLDQLSGKGFQLVIRPHPEYVKRYKPRMDAIVQRYSECEDLTFELDFTSNNSLFDSDIIITDWSGSAYEFSLVTLKPSVFINTTPKINNPDYVKLNVEPLEFKLRSEVGIQVDPDKLEGIDEQIKGLLNDSETYADSIEKIRHKYIANFGKSGEIGGKYVLEQLLDRQKKDKTGGNDNA